MKGVSLPAIVPAVGEGLDGVLRMMQMGGGAKALKPSHVNELIAHAAVTLDSLHTDGAVLCQESKVLDLPAYLDYSKVGTVLSMQQKSGLLPGDATDYRVWALRWRLRGGAAVTFDQVVPFLENIGALKRIQAFSINERVMWLNTLEAMHRGRLTMVRKLMLELAKMATLKG